MGYSKIDPKIQRSHQKNVFDKPGGDFMNYTINSAVDIWTDIANEQILMIELSKLNDGKLSYQVL